MNLKEIELVIQTDFKSLGQVLKKIFSFIDSMWDKNINKTEIKSCIYLSLDQFSSLTNKFPFALDTDLNKVLIWVSKLWCVHLESIKQYQDCFRIVSWK